MLGSSGGQGPQGLFLVLVEMVNVEKAGGFQLILVHLDGQPALAASSSRRWGRCAPLRRFNSWFSRSSMLVIGVRVGGAGLSGRNRGSGVWCDHPELSAHPIH